jgi:hypothetical protein
MEPPIPGETGAAEVKGDAGDRGYTPARLDVEVVEDLLGKSCAVEEVAPETRSRADLSLFRLTAWT